MNSFLKKIKLIDNMVIELQVEKSAFIHILKNNIDWDATDLFDVLTPLVKINIKAM